MAIDRLGILQLTAAASIVASILSFGGVYVLWYDVVGMARMVEMFNLAAGFVVLSITFIGLLFFGGKKALSTRATKIVRETVFRSPLYLIAVMLLGLLATTLTIWIFASAKVITVDNEIRIILQTTWRGAGAVTLADVAAGEGNRVLVPTDSDLFYIDPAEPTQRYFIYQNDQDRYVIKKRPPTHGN